MTLIELVEQGADRMEQAGLSFGHGTTNAFDEAVWLTLWRLGLPLEDLDSVAQRQLNPGEVEAVQALVGQRIRTRRPAAYLTGEAWLQGLPFYVDERVIVPRSLIAELIGEGVLHSWVRLGPTPRVWDLCTGNGSLAVLAARAWPQAQVDASDLSAAALEVAQMNVQRHGLGERIALRQGDGLAAGSGPYDLVLCNPPYVNSASMRQLPAEYCAEPSLALSGGEDGMDFVRPLLQGLAPMLAAEGVLVLEIGHERAHFEAAWPKLNPVWLATSAGDDAVLLLDRAALEATAAGRTAP